jgi:Immunity protein Imm1
MSRIDGKPVTTPTSGAWNLYDSERPCETISSGDVLKRLIETLPTSGTTPNRIVGLEAPNGDNLSIGIASSSADNPSLMEPLAYIQYTNASLDPPYLVPVGDAALSFENGGVVVFRYEGSWTEILKRNCVPIDMMLRIALHFYRKGSLPEWIAWEEV